LIRIARITKAQGLDGAMRIAPILDDDRVFESGRPVTLIRGADSENFEIEFSRRQHGRLILKLRGIDTISAAESLVGAELSVPEDELPPAEEGVFYTFHLKGCSVVTVGGDSLGTVSDVLDSGGTHILKVDGKDGEILIPFAQSFLRKIDLEERRIEVDLPEGLLDLNK
jgi:16S rRNA processing protein RimM